MNLDEYYSRSVEKLNKVMFTSFQTQLTFYRHLILVASTFLGILIAFHPSGATPPCTRWAFLAAVIALTLGILALSIVLHAYTALLKKFYQSFSNRTSTCSTGERYNEGCSFRHPRNCKNSRTDFIFPFYNCTCFTNHLHDPNPWLKLKDIQNPKPNISSKVFSSSNVIHR